MGLRIDTRSQANAILVQPGGGSNVGAQVACRRGISTGGVGQTDWLAEPKSYYAQEAIVEHLAELEELYLAEAELEAIRKGARTYPLSDVERELGLEG